MDLSDGGRAQVSNGHVAFGSKGNYVLLQPGKETFIVVNDADKTYMEVQQDIAKQIADMMAAQMEKMMAEIPPEQREMLKKTMQGMMPGQQEPVEKTIRRTGKESTVAGFDCSEIEVSTPGGGAEELICVASADELDISDDDYAALVGAMKAMAQMAQIGNRGAALTNFDDMGGIPIRTQGANGRKISELVGLSNDSIPADRFEVPAGYRETSIEAMLGGR
jgi:hypothetical protein